ncbi:DUF1289 domain-containing protein [Arenibaculum sp.]|jgi:hypothetical protein|uniref:DUF1289 domain-containing protein n=1 Tax=Arenibaculum sp. TaxID=2865862 RepID=UPI002E105E98|nr:DUF1289 domain-containing protein [Arenibaculum sp.]
MGKRLHDDPCIKVCKFDQGICRGCLRTRDEVKGWKAMTGEQRTAVVLRIGRPPAEEKASRPPAGKGKKLKKLDRKIAELEARLDELRRKRAKKTPKETGP